MASSALRTSIARACGGAAGFGAVLAGLLHEGFGGPMLERFLSAQAGTPPALLQQIDAAWISATLSLLLFSAALVLAALKRHGWLYSLGRPIGLWFAAYAAAEQWGAFRWGEGRLAPEALILGLLAVLTFTAAFFARPRQPRANP